jgi:GNAT superfamily N-acetyltransferase
MPFQVRYATRRDVRTLEAWALLGSESAKIIRWALNFHAQYPGSPLCVVRWDGRMVGAYVLLQRDNGFYLKYLAVRDDCQRGGWGTRIVNFIRLKFAGKISVLPTDSSVKFYRRLGFRKKQGYYYL